MKKIPIIIEHLPHESQKKRKARRERVFKEIIKAPNFEEVGNVLEYQLNLTEDVEESLEYRPEFFDKLTKGERIALEQEVFLHMDTDHEYKYCLARHIDGYMSYIPEGFSPEVPSRVLGLYGLKKLINLNSRNLEEHDEAYINAHKKIEKGLAIELGKILATDMLLNLKPEEKQAFAEVFDLVGLKLSKLEA